MSALCKTRKLCLVVRALKTVTGSGGPACLMPLVILEKILRPAREKS